LRVHEHASLTPAAPVTPLHPCPPPVSPTHPNVPIGSGALQQLRTRIADRVRPVVADARLTLSSLQSPAKLAQLFGGNLLSELILAAALGLSLGAFGASANLATLLVISIGAALFGGFMPVPGGIGVMEAALATGLAATGIDASTAMATALLFRATTYYLPPLWGWMAMRWLQRNSFL
jgi:uncharacterized membrane protein YbhN (UPF0104 family)